MIRKLKIMEIFTSFSGEVCSFHQGRLCTFIRLAGCNLSCDYCDTKASQLPSNGRDMYVHDVYSQVMELKSKYVIITGGEPLLQQENLKRLVSLLLAENFIVNIETNGSFLIPMWTHRYNHLSVPDVQPCWIVDYKMGYESLMTNSFYSLSRTDWIKFVIKNEEELFKAVDLQKDIQLVNQEVNFAYSILSGADNDNLTVEYCMEYFIWNSVDVLLNVQIHKIVGCQ